MVDAKTLRARADASVARRNYRQADKLYRELVQRDPLNAQARVRHAEVLRRLERPLEAAAAYRCAASLFHGEGQDARAKAARALALTLDPATPIPPPPPRRKSAPRVVGEDTWRGRSLELDVEVDIEVEEAPAPPRAAAPVIVTPPPRREELMADDDFRRFYVYQTP